MKEELSIRDLTAVILAGGLGTRLRSVVSDKPKVLAEVSGRPFLAYLLEQVLQAGIKQCVLCTGYLAEQVRGTFGDHWNGVKLEYSEEHQLLGTGGALRFALPMVSSETLLVLNGDSYCAAELHQFYAAHVAQRAQASIYLTEVPNTFRYGRVELGPDGMIERFEEKGATEGSGLINAGIYLMHRALLEALPKGKQVSLEKEVFPTLLGKRFFGYQGAKNIFIDIGTPDSFDRAQSLFRGKEIRS